MLIINNKILPIGRNYMAMNLFGIIFTKGRLSPQLKNHEFIHTLQQLEMLFLFFYMWYVTEWIIKSIRYKSFFKGYINISFEREAYGNANKLNYRKHRKAFNWIHYL